MHEKIVRLEPKKKKKSKNANAATYNSNPNTHYGSIWIELIVAETEN